MTLDETEKMARAYVDGPDAGYEVHVPNVKRLARALLLVLPVARAAEVVNASFCATVPAQRELKREHYQQQGAALSKLRAAIDTLRSLTKDPH